MANARLLAAVLAIAVVSQVSCAVARRHGKPEPCGRGDAGDLEVELHGHGGGTPHRQPHHCAPRVHGGTPAVMTVNGFRRGESGGGPSACDGHFHSDGELIVALSTGWFERGRRCHRPIHITSAHNGRTVVARVVDECDSRRGCRNDIVDSSPAVWRALGLDTNVGQVSVTWADA